MNCRSERVSSFGSDLSGAANHILGGWQFNGIITASSGQPIGVGIGRDIANIGARSISQRPNLQWGSEY